ncbi:MAG: tetratricopeptide repeat protein [Planctomycetota bacterium]|nr:tetratricopeptide repeat protein [Planctomycetota bacterium]
MMSCLVLCCLLASGSVQPGSVSDDLAADQASNETPPTETTQPTPAKAKPLPRVIIYPSRLRSVSGYVLEEDAKKVKIRDRQDKIHEFDTSLIYSMVRLHDIDTPAKAIVLMHDGRRREGLLEEDAFDYVRFRIHNVPHKYKREDVGHVQLLPTFDDEYEHLLKQLDPSDTQAHLSLCRWLIDQGRLVEAKAELERILQREDNTIAQRMLLRVEARLTVQAHQAEAVKSEEDTGPDPDAMPKLVSDADVNLVRVYEIELDNPPKMRVPAVTVQALLDQYGDNPLLPQTAEGQAAFSSLDSTEIVAVMFELRARDLYGDIQVMTEPALLSTFRRRIHDNWLLNNCGSRSCHGGPSEGAGRFRLHWSYRPDDRIRTSNLLALNRLELDGQQMLNWSQPKASLLYQYALPRAEATTPHPEVRGWEPVFTPGATPVREAYLQWVRDMVARHHKDWPVEYQPWSPPETPAVPQPSGESDVDSGQSP